MSVLIKGMKMPMNCWFCNLKTSDYSEYVCPFDGQEIHFDEAKRHTDCPLIELPDHGDLIDRDAYLDKLRTVEDDGVWMYAAAASVSVMPAVIPAEEERRMNDLISKQAAIKAIDDLPNCYNGYSDTYDKAYIIGVLEELPTIDPVKHGRWLPHPTEPDWDVCSVCGTGTMRRTHGYHNGAFWDAEESYSYCPWCGARMSEANDETD